MTESDRDMTRLAAVAAGYDVYEKGGWFLHRNPTVRECGGWRLTFDPRNNDGDSRRLAVKTGTILVPCTGSALATCLSGHREYYKDHDGDELSAARLAVLRASAEVGEQMSDRAAAEIAKAQQGGGNAN